eukprot:5028074-Amphidinium_carterae.1
MPCYNSCPVGSKGPMALAATRLKRKGCAKSGKEDPGHSTKLTGTGCMSLLLMESQLTVSHYAASHGNI